MDSCNLKLRQVKSFTQHIDAYNNLVLATLYFFKKSLLTRFPAIDYNRIKVCILLVMLENLVSPLLVFAASHKNMVVARSNISPEDFNRFPGDNGICILSFYFVNRFKVDPLIISLLLGRAKRKRINEFASHLPPIVAERSGRELNYDGSLEFIQELTPRCCFRVVCLVYKQICNS